MGNIMITRYHTVATITATSGAGTTSPRIGFQHSAGGGVFIPSTGGVTQINWYAADDANGQVYQVYADGAAVTTAVTVGAHPVPDACFAFRYVAPIVVGAASCDMTVSLKG